MSKIELPSGLHLEEFKPGLFFMPGLSTLEYLIEDCSYISIWVNSAIDILRHSYSPRYVGLQVWLGYDPQLLLADLR